MQSNDHDRRASIPSHRPSVPSHRPSVPSHYPSIPSHHGDVALAALDKRSSPHRSSKSSGDVPTSDLSSHYRPENSPMVDSTAPGSSTDPTVSTMRGATTERCVAMDEVASSHDSNIHMRHASTASLASEFSTSSHRSHPDGDISITVPDADADADGGVHTDVEVSSTIFDDAAREVFHLMTHDSFRRFKTYLRSLKSL